MQSSQERVRALLAAANSTRRSSGLTHSYYRYPAALSPDLVGQLVDEYTTPGDLVLDPFVGGGTTLVEASARGRAAIGCDINSLATFVTSAKTDVLVPRELSGLLRWLADLPSTSTLTNARAEELLHGLPASFLSPYTTPQSRRALHFLLHIRALTTMLTTGRARRFAKVALLRTGQWALDGRRNIPTVPDMRARLLANIEDMLADAKDYACQVQSSCGRIPDGLSSPLVVTGPASDLSRHIRPSHTPAKLVITSPPYPGIHVLYHRWQVLGRRETSLPYLLIGAVDGQPGSYYTFGPRPLGQSKSAYDLYFAMAKRSYQGIRECIDETDGLLVQALSFSDPHVHLPRFLRMLASCGFSERFLTVTNGISTKGSRTWRSVPNRKWHATMQERKPGAHEVILFHRPT